MKVAVVDCGSGNLASATRAMARAAADRGIAARVELTADPDRVARADRVVLPGQGAFADCARGIAAVDGLMEALEAATKRGAPYLGICVGMQLMAERGREHELADGFGWIAGEISALHSPGLRLPQMGWNELLFTPGAHPLLAGVAPGDHAYFVHSYALHNPHDDQVIATTEYGEKVVAMVAQANRAGTQFHAEKSQSVGLRILGNFFGLGAVTTARTPYLLAERIESFADEDLAALCEAADAAIIDGGGFGWIKSPGRRALERYFTGLLMVPERELYVARFDGVIYGSAQLARPPRHNEAQLHGAQLSSSFIAPYARSIGLARLLTRRVEEAARAHGCRVLNLDVRETQEAAIKLYESMGYVCWGVHPAYARIAGQTVKGRHYYKMMAPLKGA